MRGPFKTQNGAVTTAFFVAPVVPSLFMPLVGGWEFPPDLTGALVVYLIALPFCVVLGLPLILLFSRFRIFSWWGSLLGGALGGVAILGVVGGRYNLHWSVLAQAGALGAATGLAFWAVFMLGPEPSHLAARNWVQLFRPRR